MLIGAAAPSSFKNCTVVHLKGKEVLIPRQIRKAVDLKQKNFQIFSKKNVKHTKGQRNI